MPLFKASSPDSRKLSPGQEDADYARLITDQLAFIEKQCRRAVLQTMCGAGGELAGAPGGDGLDLDNQADELLNEVLDRLRADDFKALRSFQGKAKLTTYLTTIVANLIIDLVRQKKGRSRALDRAREMGALAERLYDLVYTRGDTLEQARHHLEIAFGICEPLETLQKLMDRIRGRGDRTQLMLADEDPESVWLVPGRQVAVDGVPEVVVADPRRNAEDALLEHQKESRAQQAVCGLVHELSGEEQLLLRMRFPTDDSEPKSFKDIGKLLGSTESSVDAKIRRILLRCRETLLRQGLTLRDLV